MTIDFNKHLKDGSLCLGYQLWPLNNTDQFNNLIQFIGNNSNVTELKLEERNIDIDHLKLLVEVLKNSNVTALNVKSNKIGDEGAAEIAKLSNLTNLNIGWNNLSAIGAAEIAKLSNLTNLNVHANEIGDEGAAKIAQLTNLIELDISYNPLTSKGATEIAKLSNLTNLNIGWNNLSAIRAAIAQLNNFTALSINTISNNEVLDKIVKLTNLSKLKITTDSLSVTEMEKLSNLINCKISLDNSTQNKIIKLMQNANNPKVTPEEVRDRMFVLLKTGSRCVDDMIKHIINSPEKYPFAINSRDAAGHSLLHFYNHKLEMQQLLFQHGIVPEQKQQGGILLRLVRDNQSVHTKEAVDLTNFTTGKLVEDYKGTKESLQEIATAYNNKLKDSTNFFNTPVKLALLSLTDASKRDTMGNALKSDSAVLDDQEFVRTIMAKASEALGAKYLRGEYSTYELQYDNKEHTVTIPESLGLVKSLIDTMEIPVADKRELLVTLMVKFPELVKDKLKIIQEKLGIDVPLKVLVNSSNCHKFLESNPIIQKTPQIISELFKDISNLDIEETLREQKEFALAVGVYMAATTYGDMTACILGTWSQIINSATEINPEFLNKFNKLKEEEAKKEKERTSITESNIQDFNNELAKKLIEFVKEKPELQESLAELGAAMIDVRKPQDITIAQQKILAQVNTQFMKMIKDYLPNYNSIIPKFEEYYTIIYALADNKALQQFVTHYYALQRQVEYDTSAYQLDTESSEPQPSEQDVNITGDNQSSFEL
ncbi:hypothetical protein [Candidatus Tisiphia endosymbiont of Temnostethus pusillus]|uniref:hypothetical protein n=1 Tax=Candidatus Tisiphia endosymbiont of Temnostethus pusillus TaxID=3139335 RepID=UPI0035C8DC6E